MLLNNIIAFLEQISVGGSDFIGEGRPGYVGNFYVARMGKDSFEADDVSGSMLRVAEHLATLGSVRRQFEA